jgi:dihydropteroate synthase
MGILNLTPDSFSDGGELLADDALDVDALVRRAEAMVAAGATILDVGAESTRPGATGIEPALEAARVVAALEALAPRVDAVLSVDSSTPAVFRAAASAGAHLINDVRALRRDGALEAAAATGLPVCVMHMRGEPATMQDDPRYDDVVAEVRAWLAARIDACVAAGIAADRIVVDPGFGFGKSLAHNLTLLRGLPAIASLGAPVLAGLSRKRTIGELTGQPVDRRVAGSVSAAVLAALGGARILRVHDVAETVDALRVAAAFMDEDGGDTA